MRRTNLIIAVLLFSLGSLSAQNFAGRLNPFPRTTPLKLDEADTLRILAIMVDFEEDLDTRTFGTGKFGTIYSENYGDEILDPLPHNQAYFENHLEFAKNYYQKASGGKVNIAYTVMPDVITMEQTMRNYAPPAGEDKDFTALGGLAEEAWTAADQLYPDLDFSRYDIFTIFHAGVGRDIIDPTGQGGERDIPSIYLSEKALKNIYGESFQGFSVDGGNFRITNTNVLPETNNREIEVIGGTSLIELTINGLIVASIGSHLGLPDLFDTDTGKSRIGRFGLMDGQSFFAYGGMFPPEPSPWEKIYLGWEEATEIPPLPGNHIIILKAHQIAEADEKTIVKIPISSTEYYLIENRSRDAFHDGARITYILNGEVLTKTFAKDDTSFSFFSSEGVDGVVLDVDEYDWAVPGWELEQTEDDPFEDIGIVIWHIDEAVINSKIEDNAINTDPDNLGVRVVEADGIQEIGEEFTDFFGNLIIGEGTKEDTWYEGNPAELYENRFSGETDPATVSNSGAKSLITIDGFTLIGNQMSFNLSFGTGDIGILSSFKVNAAAPNKTIGYGINGGELVYYVQAGTGLYKYTMGGTLIGEFPLFSTFKPAAASWNGNEYIAGVGGFGPDYLTVSAHNGTIGTIDRIQSDAELTSPAVIRITNENRLRISVGREDGVVEHYEAAQNVIDGTVMVGTTTFNTQNAITQYAYADGVEYAAAGNQIIDNNQNVTELPNNVAKFAVTDVDGVASVVALSANTFYVINNGSIVTSFDVGETTPLIEGFAVADLFNDGNNYIVFNHGSYIEARNMDGSTAEGYPYEDPEDAEYVLQPTAADLNNDGTADILATTANGKLVAINGKTAKPLANFPVAVGSRPLSTPVLFNYNGRVNLALVDSYNNLYAWNITNSEDEIYWSGEYAAQTNNAFVPAASNAGEISEFFPPDRAYNWPNPVYGNETYIRYYVSENSQVNIKIFDIAGDLVAELTDEGSGGFDNEVTWNVSGVQSGVYFAHIEANGSSGTSENKIIKIAVIK